MNKKYKDIIIEKNNQNLELIQKEVPNYDWKQQRLECKTMVWDNDFRRRKNPTQSIDTNYRQVGILTRIGSDKETVLPLMGRPLMTNRNRWNFYALSENNII